MILDKDKYLTQQPSCLLLIQCWNTSHLQPRMHHLQLKTPPTSNQECTTSNSSFPAANPQASPSALDSSARETKLDMQEILLNSRRVCIEEITRFWKLNYNSNFDTDHFCHILVLTQLCACFMGKPSFNFISICYPIVAKELDHCGEALPELCFSASPLGPVMSFPLGSSSLLPSPTILWSLTNFHTSACSEKRNKREGRKSQPIM